MHTAVWYRFDAITGGKMPESCVTTLHCGTMLPIWMNDVHPTGMPFLPISKYETAKHFAVFPIFMQ